ncbi:MULTISPECIES: hypothetical protein [Azospirillum]|uniref:Uncharacterized protein n=1 Tax=Azospirillum brasilense TaxID=192 RepID=A0ABU4P0J7_AZOBR|nr:MULTISPECIES: hypothetical protein [Azospirillum]MDW7551754.1 hypothetical protein [Azospirillum brasilense]MDW7591189.1 hypothetical protein [Azospirillum brasilense]MDW7626359.1 hypothetical protein [Azospirillum brasilense]MDX5951292.1 hypothetical protein [Azospirillum brasilense]
MVDGEPHHVGVLGMRGCHDGGQLLVPGLDEVEAVARPRASAPTGPLMPSPGGAGRTACRLRSLFFPHINVKNLYFMAFFPIDS